MNQEYLDFAYSVALSAGRIALQQYRQTSASTKADGSEVTEADRQVESLMRTMIQRRYPAHDILGEELGNSSRTSGKHLWVLDPIDGTAWYTMGTPLFGNLVALLEDGEPIVGVIHLPALGETVCAAKGCGAWLSYGTSAPQRVHVASGVPLNQATVTASGVHRSDMLRSAKASGYPLRGIVQRAGKFRFYGDCVQHALVCAGHTHAAIDTIMHPWDSAAIIPCIEEAGGVVTTLDGHRDNVVFGGSLLTSCSAELHEEIIRCLGAGASTRPAELAA